MVSFVSQPWWSTWRATRSFSRQGRFLEIWPLREMFQLQQTNKRLHGEKLVFLQLATPKAAFLMKTVPIDPHNLGIFPNKQSHSLQFTKRNRGGLPLHPASLRLLIDF